jgi:shikimate kinase
MDLPGAINNVYLIGLMGAGKSTVGKLLAKVLERQFVDLDHEIELLAGCDIPAIFEEQGETRFRDYEAQVLLRTGALKKTIIACGGGVVTQEQNMAFLQDKAVVWLDLSPAEAAARLEHSPNRPLLKGCQDTLMQLNEILLSRRAAYAQAASIHINSGGVSPEVLATDILHQLAELYA